MVRIALSNYTFSAFYCSSVSISIFYAYYRLYLIFECSHSPTSASQKHFNASYKPRSNLLYLISAASNALSTFLIKNEANGPHSGSSAPVLPHIHFPVTRIARLRLPPHSSTITTFRQYPALSHLIPQNPALPPILPIHITCLSYALKIKFAQRLHRSVNMWRRLYPRLLHLRTVQAEFQNFLKELSIAKIARSTQQLRAILHSIHPSIRSQAYPDCNPVRLFRHSPCHASS